MSNAQQFLIQFCNTQLYHSLGAYQVAWRFAPQLRLSPGAALGSAMADDGISTLGALRDAFETSRTYDSVLHNTVHSSDPQNRHATPMRAVADAIPLALSRSNPHAHDWAFAFPTLVKDAAASHLKDLHAFHAAREARQPEPQDLFQDWDFLRHFAFEPSLDGRFPAATDRKLMRRLENRRRRFEERLETATKWLPEPDEFSQRFDSESWRQELMLGCMTRTQSTAVPALHDQLLRLFCEAHMRLHHAEALFSRPFAERLTAEADPVRLREYRDLIRQSIALNTFCFALSRNCPWVFAEDHSERDLVAANSDSSRLDLDPPHCLWLSRQIGFLALYRRATGLARLRRKEEAFRDYLKVQRLMRECQRRLERMATIVPGSLEFIGVLDSLSHFRVGDLYRSDHAYARAQEHYAKALSRLEGVRQTSESSEIDTAIRLSRRRVELLLGRAKAYYELGGLKGALEWATRAWIAFLEIAAEDSQMSVSSKEAKQLIEFLERRRHEPDLSKRRIAAIAEGLVSEIETVRVSPRLKGLAADVLNRLGHFLLTLRLDQKGLALRCLMRAADYDPHNTLAQSNLINAGARETPKFRQAPLVQWPGGGGGFESLARVYEHEVLASLPPSEELDGSYPEQALAHSLLGEFLSHTDNINIKSAQVYSYLTKVVRDRRLDRRLQERGPTLEFVCLQRYSSFFPFLPRPSASRVLGGGYLIRVHGGRGNGGRPFGIVIDPGANFVENLYRAGFTLADIDMLILSHDHADHTASLDPILSLLGYRISWGGRPEYEGSRFVIAGNESVVRRYGFLGDEAFRGRVALLPIRQLATGPLEAGLWLPPGIRFEVVEGIHRDFAGNHSCGIRIELDDGPSIGITGDTGAFVYREGGSRYLGTDVTNWRKHWRPILSADIVVAHMSAVPFSQLLQVARLGVESSWLEALLARLGDENFRIRSEPLRQQFESVFWLRGKGASSEPTVASAFSVPPEGFRPGSRHLYLAGLIEFAREFRQYTVGQPRLFVVSELREELSTFRTKVAKGLNAHILGAPASPGIALTGDIFLAALVGSSGVEVLCSTCENDNDVTPDERFWPPNLIREVCVKGENEGIFYNCEWHDPGGRHKDPGFREVHTDSTLQESRTDPTFQERMERYDVFARGPME